MDSCIGVGNKTGGLGHFSQRAACRSVEVIENKSVNDYEFKKYADEKPVHNFLIFIFPLESIALYCKVRNTLAAPARLGLQDGPRG